MTLPKCNQPTFNVDLPNAGKAKFRPMLWGEEKILAVAKESEKRGDIIEAITQVVNNCKVDGPDIKKFSMIDAEWAFLQLRKASVSNMVETAYRDIEDDKVHEFKIDLNDVEIKNKKGDDKPIVELTDEVSVEMKPLPLSFYSDNELYDMQDVEMVEKMTRESITKIYQGENAYDVSSSTKEEVDEFLNSVPLKGHKAMQEWINNQPHMFYEVKYKNDSGKEKVIPLTTLEDFFPF